MKNLAAKLIIFVFSFSLVACSSNTRNQNTTLGAVSGAVIGGLLLSPVGHGAGKAAAIVGGAIVGALIGGYVGRHMEHCDKQKMYQCLDTCPTRKCTSWTNQKTKTSYSVVPTSNKYASNGYSTCRNYNVATTSNGQTQETSGLACRQDNGAWGAISNS